MKSGRTVHCVSNSNTFTRCNKNASVPSNKLSPLASFEKLVKLRDQIQHLTCTHENGESCFPLLNADRPDICSCCCHAHLVVLTFITSVIAFRFECCVRTQKQSTTKTECWSWNEWQVFSVVVFFCVCVFDCLTLGNLTFLVKLCPAFSERKLIDSWDSVACYCLHFQVQHKFSLAVDWAPSILAPRLIAMQFK